MDYVIGRVDSAHSWLAAVRPPEPLVLPLAPPGYCFRIRFTISPVHAINCAEASLPLVSGSCRVELKAAERGRPIADAEKLVVVGSGFKTEARATSTAEQWQAAIQVAFAHHRVGVDFGQRAPEGAFTEAGLRWAEAMHGVRRALNDDPGIMVYECAPAPVFVSSEMRAKVGKNADELKSTLVDAFGARPIVSDRHGLAFELFSGSFFQPAIDAKFVMLMMAVETLLDPQARSHEAQERVRRMIADVKSSDLEKPERDSIAGTLEWMKQESIGQAGRRVAKGLGQRTYNGLTPSKFFTASYNLRSALVHGRVPRPSRQEVAEMVPAAEQFVGDLLSVPFLEA